LNSLFVGRILSVKRFKSPSAIPFFVLLFILVLSPSTRVSAQKEKPSKESVTPTLTRTIPRHENFRLAYGGSVTIVGAPAGSITIEGWQRNEVDLSAEIELHGGTTQDLDRLAAVNTFVADEDTNHIRILTTGTHDRKFMKSVAKDFPRSLFGLPWKIDYHLKVPLLTDVEISAGNGPITLSGVEGAIRLDAVESTANLSLTGGLVAATIQTGRINITVPTRGWHGLGAEIRLASGDLTVELAPGFSGDLNAEVLRHGEIRNSFPNLEPRERNSIASHSLRARAGSGGATLTLIVGDGVIQLRQIGPAE
jgi:hypothetical protein